MKTARWLAIAILAVALLTMWARQVTGTPVEKDSAQLLRMAINLERHGVISLEEAPPFTPTDYREPIPVFAYALGIRFMDSFLGAAPPDAYFSGERVKQLKYQNLIWLAVLSVGAFWATHVLTSSFWLGLLAVVLVNMPFAGGRFDAGLVDGLYSDVPATAFLMLACTSLAIGVAHRKLGFIALTGLLFGMLTLVKAAVLYVFVGVVLLLPCFYLLQRYPIRNAARECAVLILTFACTIAPWMFRNHVELGSFQLSQRAGVVLMYRALKDQMTPQEYKGSFYVWGPNSLQGALGRMLGFSPADLRRGGRLQHLNTALDSDFAADDLAAERAGRPDQTLTYYRQARAERTKIEAELDRAGRPQAELEGDDILKKRAMALILAHPWRHLALTVPFLWRGATFAFPILVFALVIGMRRRRYDLVLFALPALGLVMFFALFSHFISRYGIPAREVATVVLVALVALFCLPKTNRAFSGYVMRDASSVANANATGADDLPISAGSGKP
jgi:hypothetical protein